MHEGGKLEIPRRFERPTRDKATMELLAALMDWRVTLRPEMVELSNWPNLQAQHFISKHLWHGRFHEQIIRNDIDLRETVEYTAVNPVKRRYVSKPQYYPFTGFDAGESLE